MAKGGPVFEIGGRKELFIDDAFLTQRQNIAFEPNPPERMEKVADAVRGHLTMVEDEQGLPRSYYRGPDDAPAVMTSRDGVHWDKPDVGHGEVKGWRNVVLPQSVGLGAVFTDPNAPPEQRYKCVSGIKRQAAYVFYSRAGYWFERNETAALPFSAGSQSAAYYDHQRQLYVFHHRSDTAWRPEAPRGAAM